ncbi:MAG: aldo/keto reductase [Thermoguttaceae bacterium]|nr:aldo/keto reductase [Thermoguttaceae bacterium]
MSHPSNSPVSRRAFIRNTGLMTGASMLSTQPVTGGDREAPPLDTIPDGLPRRILGRTKVPVTTFTMGTAACGSLPPAEIAKLVNVALDEGVNSVDTSERYQNSQEGVGLALGKRRKDVFLSTKVFANSIPEAEASLARSIRELKTDYIDLLYYHGLGNLNIEGAMEPGGVFTWLLKQKQAGKCRFVGVSGHHLPGRFQQFLESGEVDVMLVTVNFIDRHTYNFEERVLPLARKHDVGIVAMKVYGGMAGMKYAKPGPAQLAAKHVPAALRYALSVPGVATANIGVHSIKEIRHNVHMAKDFQPLSEEELADLLKQGKPLAADWGEHFGPVEERF